MMSLGKMMCSTMIALMIGIMGTAPTLAKIHKQEKDIAFDSPTKAVKQTTDSVPNGRYGHQPGPAWRTIGGTIKHIKGDVYTVEDYEGNRVQLYISRETKQLRGNKKVGDRVRAEITRSGFANSIQ